MSGDIVWVARVEMKYDVMAVANTKETAIQLAGREALKFLRQNDCTTQETNTVAKIINYFGVSTHQIKVGTAILAD